MFLFTVGVVCGMFFILGLKLLIDLKKYYVYKGFEPSGRFELSGFEPAGFEPGFEPGYELEKILSNLKKWNMETRGYLESREYLKK